MAVQSWKLMAFSSHTFFVNLTSFEACANYVCEILYWLDEDYALTWGAEELVCPILGPKIWV